MPGATATLSSYFHKYTYQHKASTGGKYWKVSNFLFFYFWLLIIVRLRNRMKNSSHVVNHYWMCRVCVDYMEAAGDVLVEFEGVTGAQEKFTV
jgi:hypothetical protein